MAKKKPLLSPGSILGPLRELRKASRDVRPLVVAGAPAPAAELRRALAEDGDAGAVRDGSPRGAAALVYVLTAAPDEADVRALREARLMGVPTVAVAPDPAASIPYVLATDQVAAGPGAVAEVARVLARRLGDGAAGLAARLPVLREAVSERLVASFARRNAIVGAAVFIPGADMPVMTINQMRLVMRLAAAHGLDPEPARALELAGVLGGGFGLRYLGRSLLGLVPVAGFAVRAGVGYAGTKAVGEAAARYYATRE
jgi:uncharacterized protein (DUF697 family)